MIDTAIGDSVLTKPLVLGHECSAFDTTSGQLVALDPAVPCGKCESCREGNHNLCPEVKFAGHGQMDGALREYICWPVNKIFRLPKDFNAIDGAMLEPLGVAIYAHDLVQMHPRMQLGVFGCGPIGLLLIQLLKLRRPRMIAASDRLEHRLKKAQSLGSDLQLLVDQDGHPNQLNQQIGNRGLDIVFETAGEPEAVESAVAAARPGGTVVIVGIPAKDQIAFCASTARRKGLQIILCRRMNNTYPRAIRLVEDGLIDVRTLVTHRFPLNMVEKAFEIAAKRDGLKVIIEPHSND